LINELKKKIKLLWLQWVKKRSHLTNPQKLNSSNLYILPSAFGLAYGCVLLSLFIGAINYQISAVFLMTFLLAIIGLLSMLESHKNLKGLIIKCIELEDGFVGQFAKVHIYVKATNSRRFGLAFKLNGEILMKIEQLPYDGQSIILPLKARTRGFFKLPMICICSFFPFGLFRVWGYVNFDKDYYIYPQPLNPGFWPSSNVDFTEQQNLVKQPGDEDFYQLKPVDDPWQQAGRIAWKIAARGQGWYLKTMTSSVGKCLLFRISDLPEKDIELSLQHLCYWVKTAQTNGYQYGLELNGHVTKISSGHKHLIDCLRQLARYR
jgi:uncharacterized protein (DUF58 family)